jgi:hypothetical protein
MKPVEGQSPPANEPQVAGTAATHPEEQYRDEARQHLTAARRALATGNYAAAFIEIELASGKTPSSLPAETLLLSGLLYAAPENPTGDIQKAHDTILLMERDFPESEWVGEGRVLTGLIKKLQAAEAENQRLSREIVALNKKLSAERNSVQSLKSLLKKMKEIDLGIQPEE